MKKATWKDLGEIYCPEFISLLKEYPNATIELCGANSTYKLPKLICSLDIDKKEFDKKFYDLTLAVYGDEYDEESLPTAYEVLNMPMLSELIDVIISKDEVLLTERGVRH